MPPHEHGALVSSESVGEITALDDVGNQQVRAVTKGGADIPHGDVRTELVGRHEYRSHAEVRNSERQQCAGMTMCDSVHVRSCSIDGGVNEPFRIWRPIVR